MSFGKAWLCNVACSDVKTFSSWQGKGTRESYIKLHKEASMQGETGNPFQPGPHKSIKHAQGELRDTAVGADAV